MTPEAHIEVLRHLQSVLRTIPDSGDEPKCTSPSYLIEFADRAVLLASTMPIDKLGRWTGFIQGVMASRGWLDVAAERDRTRPIFNRA